MNLVFGLGGLVLFRPFFIFQSIGFLVPYWVTTEACNANGLFYRCCGENGTRCTFWCKLFDIQ